MVTTDHRFNHSEPLSSNNVALTLEEIKIELISKDDEEEVSKLIRRNLEQFGNSTSVLAASFRRLKNLAENYSKEGYRLFVAKNPARNNELIGCAGLGPLKGLPLSERIGEIRDLVVELPYRSKGIGSRLLHRCISEAKAIGYNRLYLETTQNMIQARKLFLRTGFRPVTEKNPNTMFTPSASDLPCYFLLEDLSKD
jgi:putative acetyltransferase